MNVTKQISLENGFISNPVEGAKLDSEEGQQEIAEAIAQAILSYKKDFFDGGESIDAPVEKPSQRIDNKVPSDSNNQKKSDTVEKKNEEKVEENKPEKGLVFKVQISASPKKLELTPDNFKGLKNISISHDKL